MNDTNENSELFELLMSADTKEKRLYELWYEFLNRTDPATWSADVKRDFGEVLTKTFNQWLATNYFLLFFHYGPMVGPKAIDLLKELPVQSFVENTDISDIDWNTHFVLVVERGHSHREIMSEIEDSVRLCTEEEGVQNKAGRKVWEKSKALYSFATRPDHDALMLTLLIHDIQRDNENEESWTYWKTGVEVKQRISGFSDEVKAAVPMDFLPLMKYGNAGPDADEKILLGAAVKRILDRAERIKAGVINGTFPAV